MAKKKSNINYKTKVINGRIHMICQNSDSDSKYYLGKQCDNWVSISNKEIISVLCSSCTSQMCRTPQKRKRNK